VINSAHDVYSIVVYYIAVYSSEELGSAFTEYNYQIKIVYCTHKKQ